MNCAPPNIILICKMRQSYNILQFYSSMRFRNCNVSSKADLNGILVGIFSNYVVCNFENVRSKTTKKSRYILIGLLTQAFFNLAHECLCQMFYCLRIINVNEHIKFTIAHNSIASMSGRKREKERRYLKIH